MDLLMQPLHAAICRFPSKSCIKVWGQNELNVFGQNEAIKDFCGACRRRNRVQPISIGCPGASHNCSDSAVRTTARLRASGRAMQLIPVWLFKLKLLNLKFPNGCGRDM